MKLATAILVNDVTSSIIHAKIYEEEKAIDNQSLSNNTDPFPTITYKQGLLVLAYQQHQSRIGGGHTEYSRHWLNSCIADDYSEAPHKRTSEF
jgi:hypothetical protein